MRIQHIDMAVPIVDGTDETDTVAKSELAREEADLESLAGALVHALRQRDRIAWSEHARNLRAEQFRREVKGIVKRFASGAVVAIADKNGRQEARVRIYMDALALIDVLTADHEQRQSRARLLRRWLGGAVSVAVVAGLAAIVFSGVIAI